MVDITKEAVFLGHTSDKASLLSSNNLSPFLNLLAATGEDHMPTPIIACLYLNT